MLVFDLNSLVTVLIARKLGATCNVSSIDLQIENSLPRFKDRKSLLDLSAFNTNRMCLSLDDSGLFFSEMAETILNVIMNSSDEKLPMGEMINATNCAISSIIDSRIEDEEEKFTTFYKIYAKFKETRISFPVCTFIQENLLSVEGLKVDEPAILLLFGIVWQAISNQVQISTDKCDQQLLAIMKAFSSLYEFLSFNEQKTYSNEGKLQGVSKQFESVLSRTLFLWLGLNIKKSKSCAKHEGLYEYGPFVQITEEIFSFLCLPEDVSISSVENAISHQHQRLCEIEEVLPIATNLLKEVKRHVSLVSKLPLIIALLADELYCQSVLGIMGIQPEAVSWENVEMEDESKSSIDKLIKISPYGISRLIHDARKPLRVAILQCLIDLRNGQRVYKGGSSVVAVLIALSLEVWKSEKSDFYSLMTSSENVAASFLASASNLSTMNYSNLYIKIGTDRLLVILTLLLQHRFIGNGKDCYGKDQTLSSTITDLFKGLSTIVTSMLENAKKIVSPEESNNMNLWMSRKRMPDSFKMDEVMQFITYFRLLSSNPYLDKWITKPTQKRSFVNQPSSTKDTEVEEISVVYFPFVGNKYETCSMRLKWIKLLMDIECWSESRCNLVLRLGLWNTIKSICLSLTNLEICGADYNVDLKGELVASTLNTTENEASTSSSRNVTGVPLRKYVIDLLMEKIYHTQWDLTKITDKQRSAFHSVEDNNGTDPIDIEFNLEKSMYCTKGDTRNTLLHGSGGKGYCLGSTGITSGCVQWTFDILKETKGNEGTCVGVSLANVKDYSHRTTKDMWLYRAYSGNLYHNGEVPSALPEFTEGDSITAQLDMDEGTISFGKNGGPLRLAFTDLPTNKFNFGPRDVEVFELFPVVVFYSLNPGEKVRIKDMKEDRKNKQLGCGAYNGNCSPVNETVSQHIVKLVQDLYTASLKEEYNELQWEEEADSEDTNPHLMYKKKTDSWKRCIEVALSERLTSQKAQKCTEVLENQCKREYQNKNGATSLKDDIVGKDCQTESNLLPLLSNSLNQIWPALAVLSNIDSGLKVGSRVRRILAENDIPDEKLQTGYIVGAPSDDSIGINVAWEPSNLTTVIPFTKIEECRLPTELDVLATQPLDKMSDVMQDLLNADTIKMLLSMSKVTEIISLAFNSKRDWRKAFHKTEIGNEGDTKPTLAPNPTICISSDPTDTHSMVRTTKDGGRDKRSSSLPDSRILSDVSSGVESLTNSLVTSIMDEVTGKKLSALSVSSKPSQTSPLLKTSLIANLRGRSPKPGASKQPDADAGTNSNVVRNDGGEQSTIETVELEQGTADHATENAIEDLMVKASFLELSSFKTLLKLVSSSDAIYLLQLATDDSQLTQQQKNTVNMLRKVVEFCTVNINAKQMVSPLNRRFVKVFELERSLSVLHLNYSKRQNTPRDRNVTRVGCTDGGIEKITKPLLPRPSPRTSMPYARAATTSLFDTTSTPSFAAQLTAATAAAIQAIDTREPETERDDDTLEILNLVRANDTTSLPSNGSTVAAATLPPPTSIHGPLREMGFQDEHITESLAILNLDGTDTSAQRINQCAGWMIDHPWPSSSPNNARNGNQ